MKPQNGYNNVSLELGGFPGPKVHPITTQNPIQDFACRCGLSGLETGKGTVTLRQNVALSIPTQIVNLTLTLAKIVAL